MDVAGRKHLRYYSAASAPAARPVANGHLQELSDSSSLIRESMFKIRPPSHIYSSHLEYGSSRPKTSKPSIENPADALAP